MESQVIRDSLLKSAGLLDERMGGPSLEADKPHPRRSLYFRHSRDDQERFLGLFDDASILECYRRSESIIPQQALALSNSQLSMDAAMGIAHHLGWEEKTRPHRKSDLLKGRFKLLLGGSLRRRSAIFAGLPSRRGKRILRRTGNPMQASARSTR